MGALCTFLIHGTSLSLKLFPNEKSKKKKNQIFFLSAEKARFLLELK